MECIHIHTYCVSLTFTELEEVILAFSREDTTKYLPSYRETLLQVTMSGTMYPNDRVCARVPVVWAGLEFLLVIGADSREPIYIYMVLYIMVFTYES